MTINEQILLWANGYHTPFLDMLISTCTMPWTWLPFYVAIFTAFVYKYGWIKGIYYLAFIGMAIGCADYICASIIRPMFQMMRPSNPDNPFSQYVTIVNGYRGGPNGMPSCHAANCFALAVSIITFTRTKWLTIMMLLWAIFVCYTRLYMGVHYPGDLLAGASVGSVLGFLFAKTGLILGNRWTMYRNSTGYRMRSFQVANPLGSNGVVVNLTPVMIPLIVLLVTLMGVTLFAI